MKNFLLLIFSFFLLNHCSKIEEHKANNDRAIKNLKGNVKSTEEKYYKPTQIHGEIYKGDKLKNNYSSIFDKNGFLIEENVYDSEFGNHKIRYTHNFDKYGNLIETNSGPGLSKFQYQYDEKGNKIDEKCFAQGGFMGNGLQFRNTYKYDNKGKEIEKICYLSNDTVYFKTYTFYDSKGNKIAEIDSGNSSRKYLTYKYDSKGNEIEEIDNKKGIVKKYIKFDEQANWTYLILYEENKPSVIIERQIGYY